MAEAFVVDVPGWRKLQWLRHGFSVRRGGVSTVYGGRSLNVGWTKEDDPANIAENRRLLVEAAGGPAMKLVTIRQVHGNRIWPVSGEDARAGRLETHDGKAVLEGDGLVTDAPGVLLAAGTADCVPVLLVDPVRRAVGAFHAGWRGTAARIVEQGVAAMRKEYGSRPEDLLAAVGPSIGACCYTVGEEVREKFSTEFSYGEELLSKVLGEDGSAQLRIDLWEANRRQLLVAGVAPNAISLIGECTGCKLEEDGGRRYFSHRMEEGRTGRMLNVIGISAEGAGV
ncbi:MAG TPA: peptidoglycan editing factor PgeF [Edaphobacter sp.]